MNTSVLSLLAMARAAGFALAERIDDARAWAERLPGLLAEPGPTLIHAVVEPGDEGPIGRKPSEPARYLQHSLAEWSAIMRRALTGETPT